jgi:DNA-binding PadR family transcriptional regulator
MLKLSWSKKTKMLTIENIVNSFDDGRLTFLTAEQAICYVADRLIAGDSYGTELIQELVFGSTRHRISDTICCKALAFLVTEGLATSVELKVAGRGRPRRMYSLVKDRRKDAVELASCWRKMVKGGKR